MLTRNRLVIVVVLVAIIGLVTACALLREMNGVAADEPNSSPASTAPTTTGTQPSPTTPTSPSATPTLTPTQTAVTAAVTNYYKVTDELEQKPPRDPYKQLFTVAKGEAFLMWQDEITNAYTRGQHATGNTKVLQIKLGKSRAVKGRSQVTVQTCVDVSNVDVVDKKGKSVVPSSRPDRFSSEIQMERYGEDWFVTTDHDGSSKC